MGGTFTYEIYKNKNQLNRARIGDINETRKLSQLTPLSSTNEPPVTQGGESESDNTDVQSTAAGQADGTRENITKSESSPSGSTSSPIAVNDGKNVGFHGPVEFLCDVIGTNGV